MLIALGILFVLFITFIVYCCLVASGRESELERKRYNDDFQDME